MLLVNFSYLILCCQFEVVVSTKYISTTTKGAGPGRVSPPACLARVCLAYACLRPRARARPDMIRFHERRTNLSDIAMTRMSAISR